MQIYGCFTQEEWDYPRIAITASGPPLGSVKVFKYHGILLSHDLSWSERIQSVCSKAKKILSLLYRRFSNNAPSSSLVQLYPSLVRPHLDYASAIWSPYLKSHHLSIEDLRPDSASCTRLPTNCAILMMASSL